MKRQSLSDAQSWLIVCSPEMDAVTLGEAMGIKPSTIRNARARFRRAGFSCRVAYVPCQGCGELLIQPGFRAGRARYHPSCRDISRQQIQRRLDQARWQRLSPLERDRALERIHAADASHQEDTRAMAVHALARWTEDEDGYLMAHWREPAHQIARSLGRSLYAIRARRSALRRRGLAPELQT